MGDRSVRIFCGRNRGHGELLAVFGVRVEAAFEQDVLALVCRGHLPIASDDLDRRVGGAVGDAVDAQQGDDEAEVGALEQDLADAPGQADGWGARR